MEEERSGNILGLSKEKVMRACSLAMEAHKSIGYIKEEDVTSREVVFAFSGSWCVQDWFVQEPFGETTIDLEMFPCLKSIGSDEAALVNQSFLARFANTCFHASSQLQNEIAESMITGKNIVFAGHSSGSPMAILTTIWFLENYKRRGSTDDLFKYRCLTFGSPLVGNHIFPHALNRQGWAQCFIHFVGRYDIVPRIMLAPLSSIEEDLKAFLHTVDPTSETFTLTPKIPVPLFISILKNASSVASLAACQLMGGTNFLLKTISSFIKLSPYRPFGRYAFLTGKKIVVVNNPCAALQILFYSLQPSSESEVTEFIQRCSRTDYENELTEIFQQTQNVVYLKDLKVIPLSLSGNMSDEMITINKALIDLGLGARARLCLRAADEVEEQKKKNREAILSKMEKINEILCKVHNYKRTCEDHKEGYYDAFKNQKNYTDCNANIDRLKLAGEWDEIIEMLKRYELPDDFETESEWVDLGTDYRQLVEPLDISNFYRHGKNELSGEYEEDGVRPKRYRYTQRWLEHAKMLKNGSSSETTFWAKVEVMKSKYSSSMYAEMEEKIVALEKAALDLVRNKELGEDVFLEKSTFVEWWETLPRDHQKASCLKDYMRSFIQQ